jgi:lipopolysaccharide transport system ATP-binding protein
MNSTVITVDNLSKKYILSHQRESYTALRDVIAGKFKAVSRKVLHPFTFHLSPFTDSSHEEFWALKDVSFEIKKGDRVGIIGRNGAGKSTLLKVLSRITEPTSGRVGINGRVASLLEVGTGFHPELTGRENIFLNGAILGMTRAEIKRKFDEIVAFAEVEKFLDTPVKHYSSGMYVRLAFAVAAHLEPEILIVDEVLSVGDAQFQKKCLGKMEDVSAKEGRTVLFVSHNMEAVRKLCNGCILLHQGEVIASGNSESVISEYIVGGFQNQSEFTIPAPKGDVPGFAFKLVVEDNSGKPTNEIPVGRPWQIRIYFKVNRTIQHFIIALGFLTELNTPLRTSWSKPQTIEPGEYQAVFRENNLLLTNGIYPIIVGLSSNERAFQYVEDAGFLRISEISEGVDLVKIRNVGLLLNPLEIEIHKL